MCAFPLDLSKSHPLHAVAWSLLTHESLRLDVDLELHAGVDVGWDGDEVGLRGASRLFGCLIDPPDILRHGYGAAARFSGGRERRDFEEMVVRDRFRWQCDLQGLSRTRRRRASYTNPSGACMHGEVGSWSNARRHRDTEDLRGSGGCSGDRVSTGPRCFGRGGGAWRSCSGG